MSSDESSFNRSLPSLYLVFLPVLHGDLVAIDGDGAVAPRTVGLLVWPQPDEDFDVALDHDALGGMCRCDMTICMAQYSC